MTHKVDLWPSNICIHVYIQTFWSPDSRGSLTSTDSGGQSGVVLPTHACAVHWASYRPRIHFLACGCFWGYPPLRFWKMWAIDDKRLLFLHIPDSLLSRECWAGYKQAGLDECHSNLAMSISHPTKGWQHRGRSRFQSLKGSLWIKLALFPALMFYFQCKVTKGLRLTKWEPSDVCLFVTIWLRWQSGSTWKLALRAAMFSASASLSAEGKGAETRNTKNQAAKARWSRL